MDANFFRHFLDHHRLELVDTSFEEISLPEHNRITNFQNGLLALFDVFDQLNGALKALFDVIARVAVVAIASQQFAICRIQSQRGYIVVVHHDQPLVAMLHKSDIRLNQARLHNVVAQARSRIECANVPQGGLHGLYRPVDGAGNFLVLLVL